MSREITQDIAVSFARQIGMSADSISEGDALSAPLFDVRTGPDQPQEEAYRRTETGTFFHYSLHAWIPVLIRVTGSWI